MQTYSTGDVAKLLGISRDKVQSSLARGAPVPEGRAGKFYVFNESDVCTFCDWMEGKGIAITRPAFAPKSTLVVA